MTEQFLLVGFEKRVVTNIRSLFPELEIMAVPSAFSFGEFCRYCKGKNYIFINSDPEVYFNFIKNEDYISTPGSGIIRYYGDREINLDTIWDRFCDRQVFVFGLPQELHVKGLYEIARLTGSKVKTSEKTDCVTLDIKIEHRNYLAGFIFSQLFSFFPEAFSNQRDYDLIIEELYNGCEDQFKSINGLMQEVRRKVNLTQQNLKDISNQISDLAKEVKKLTTQTGECMPDTILQSFPQEQYLTRELLREELEEISRYIQGAEKGTPEDPLQSLRDRISQLTKLLACITPEDLGGVFAALSKFSQQTTTETAEIYIKLFGPDNFNNVEEVILDDNNPLKKLYPEYINYHLHRWLEKFHDGHNLFPDIECCIENRDYPVRQLVNKFRGFGGDVFLLPPPESTDDIIMPIAAVLDDLIRKSQNTETVPDLRELYKSRFSTKSFPIIGESIAMQILFRQIIPVLNDKTGHVLILGEAGTGKELVANIIKEWQRIKLSSVNCSHLLAKLAVSQLFGHKKGAFTGATSDTEGYIKKDATGSLFLDEIQSLPSEVTSMLLRYLECGEFSRLGDTAVYHSSIRIIAATNDDDMLKGKFINSGFISRFRYVIRVPSLKYRLSDIPLLVKFFTKKAAIDLKLSNSAVIPQYLVEVLKNADWQHSNVRGLKSAVYNLLARGSYSTTDVVVPTELQDESASEQKHLQRGPKQKITDELLEEYLNTSANSEELKAKLDGYYNTKCGMLQRINSSVNKKELKSLFYQKFVKDYPT